MNPRAKSLGPIFQGKPRGTCLPAGRLTLIAPPLTPPLEGEGMGGAKKLITKKSGSESPGGIIP